uniref:T-cell surface glycoprotein CD3 zeta chain n=1 Tax=Poecilia latipinna TaxID=48699 RepID=A0A3B3UL38_9TELE
NFPYDVLLLLLLFSPIADPQLCYILDGFLGLYGLIITGMFIKEKVGGTCSTKPDGSATRDTYDSLQMQPLPAR